MSFDSIAAAAAAAETFYCEWWIVSKPLHHACCGATAWSSLQPSSHFSTARFYGG
ncbi:hypothetical protein [Variovorax sp. WS11]|uniref:hypothetical protein n=1 Tax=Variovorax sp. WS11 TaxID=1105204 RepID=UPI0013DB4EDA|nr:hypothetical protein [Variovorax sp. WS11]NDZ18947.1 hypothetical protein [Variovorax sp. WS11]